MTKTYKIVPWTNGRYQALANGQIYDTQLGIEVVPNKRVGCVAIRNEANQLIYPRAIDLLAHAWFPNYSSITQEVELIGNGRPTPINIRITQRNTLARPDVLENNWRAETYAQDHVEDDYVEFQTTPQVLYRVYPDNTIMKIRIKDGMKLLNYYAEQPWNINNRILLNSVRPGTHAHKKFVIDADYFRNGKLYQWVLDGSLEASLRKIDNSKLIRFKYPKTQAPDPVEQKPTESEPEESKMQNTNERAKAQQPLVKAETNDKVLTVTKQDGSKVEIKGLSTDDLKSLIQGLV